MIERVSTSFVPVAVNLYKVREAQDAGGELFRSVQKQKDQYQGLWIVAPDGRVLAGHHDFQKHSEWTREVLATIDAALTAFGAVEPRSVRPGDLLPDRGCGVQDDGRVTVAVYTRFVLGGGRETAPADYPAGRLWHYDGRPRPDGPVTIDSITFTAEEWTAFSPPRLEAGAEWTFPDAVSARFYRVLSPTSDQSHLRGRILKVNELRGRVESIDGQHARLRLTGRWETDHPYEGRRIRLRSAGEGAAVFDVTAQTLESLVLVCHGAPLDDEGQAARPSAAVVEWQRSGR